MQAGSRINRGVLHHRQAVQTFISWLCCGAGTALLALSAVLVFRQLASGTPAQVSHDGFVTFTAPIPLAFTAALLFTAWRIPLSLRQRREPEQSGQQRSLRHRPYDDLPVPVCIIREGHLEYFNNALLELLGFSAGEISEMRLLDAVHPADRELVSGYLAQLQHGALRRASTELRLRRRGGDAIWVVADAQAQEQSGRREIPVVIHDISAAKRAATSLAASEAGQRRLLEQLSEGVGAMDANEVVTYANPAMERIFGVAPGTLAGRSLREFTDAATWELLQAATARRERQPSETYVVQIVRPGGELRQVQIAASASLDELGNFRGTQAILHDVTEQQREREERERLVQELMGTVAENETLHGLLPICASCKRIRDEQGEWTQIETYISERSQAKFSHGICPECTSKLYPYLELT